LVISDEYEILLIMLDNFLMTPKYIMIHVII